MTKPKQSNPFSPNPEVFRLAAERIYLGHNDYCCTAIDQQATQEERDCLHYFTTIFCPIMRHLYWWDYDVTPQTQNARMVALLLAAILAEEGQIF